MKHISLIAFLLLIAFNLCAQDSVVKQKLKIHEIAIVGTFPILTFYNNSSQKQIVLNVLDENKQLLPIGVTATRASVQIELNDGN